MGNQPKVPSSDSISESVTDLQHLILRDLRFGISVKRKKNIGSA